MKKTLLTLSAILLLSACSQVEEKEPAKPHHNKITAKIAETPATKTHLSQDDEGQVRKVLWSKGDRILVSGSYDKIFYTENDGTASATFYPEDGIDFMDLSTGVIAAYPADGIYMSGPDAEKEIYLTIPNVQQYAEGTFADNTMPMVSDVAYDPELRFSNAAGVLRLFLSTDAVNVKISSILIQANEMIASDTGGDLCYIPATREYNFDPEYTYGTNTVRLDCGEGVHIDSDGTPFYIVVPHQTYTGLTITTSTTEGEKQMFTLKEGKEISVKRSGISTIPLKINQLSKPTVSIEQTSSTFQSIRVKILMENVSSFYCGIAKKEAFDRDFTSGSLISDAPYTTLYTNTSNKVTYEGSAFRFQKELGEILVEPGQKYVMWILPHKDSGTYTAEDFVYLNIETQKLKPGGTIEVSYSNLVVDMTSISMDVSAKGASIMYAALLNADIMAHLDTEEELIEYVTYPGGPSVIFEGSSETFVRKQLYPDTEMTIVILPVNITGVYGKVFTLPVRTEAIPYSSLSVEIEEKVVTESGQECIKWNVSGGEASGFRYIIRPTDSYLWTSTLQGSVLRAQETMYLSPELYYIEKTSGSYAPLNNLVRGTEYMLVVTAVDQNDASSIADSWTFVY